MHVITGYILSKLPQSQIDFETGLLATTCDGQAEFFRSEKDTPRPHWYSEILPYIRKQTSYVV
jgi:hypothetical protein